MSRCLLFIPVVEGVQPPEHRLIQKDYILLERYNGDNRVSVFGELLDIS